MALPSQDLPDGAVSVRVVKQALGNNVVGTTVTVTGDGVSDSAPTDESGRAIFAALGPGKTAVASVTVDGETVKSQPFQVPARGGLRVIIAVGLDGAAAGSTAPPRRGTGGAADASGSGHARHGRARHAVAHDRGFRRREARGVPHLRVRQRRRRTGFGAGAPQDRHAGRRRAGDAPRGLDAASPRLRASARRRGAVRCRPHRRTGRLSLTHHGRATARSSSTLPVASMATNVIVRRLGETRLAAPAAAIT